MNINQTPDQAIADMRKRLAEITNDGDMRKLADVTKIPYGTLCKLSQGITSNPRIGTFLPLMAALDRHAKTGTFKPKKARNSVVA